MTETGPISLEELRCLAEAVVELSQAGEPWGITLTWEPGLGIGLVARDPRSIAILRRLGFQGEGKH